MRGVDNPTLAEGSGQNNAFLSATFGWNDFALAAVLTANQAKTMALMILSFRGPEGVFWGPMAAGATLSIAPPILLMLILQKWMVRGLTMGATKG